ncbi:MAG: 16S rRNA (uracil(1498)-N(3))-methyltransferase [Planctomycetes bacterium]|nr:16S rRNA (uracil(1498)-N(3))-methyltransferase [Planctomycetota bacterium]
MGTLRLHCPDLAAGRLVIRGAEAYHAAVTRRVHVGDRVILFDGAGCEASAEVSAAKPREITLSVATPALHVFDAPRRVTVAVASPKPERQPQLIEKCTELGVAAVWPVAAHRGVALPSSAGLDKWRRRTIEACKQCGRRWLPVISDTLPLSEVLRRSTEFDAAVMLHPTDRAESFVHFLRERWGGEDTPGHPPGHAKEAPLPRYHGNATPTHAAPGTSMVTPSRDSGPPRCPTLLVLIGPEGGWTDEELAQARTRGVAVVRLGGTILRTETAAMVACALAVFV